MLCDEPAKSIFQFSETRAYPSLTLSVATGVINV